MDSKLVVEQMSGRWRIKHPDLQALAAQARQAARALGRVTYTWVPRERNKHADRLANEAMDAAAGGTSRPNRTGAAGGARARNGSRAPGGSQARKRAGTPDGSGPRRHSGPPGLW
jgi:probable phosphoglycerate mutase